MNLRCACLLLLGLALAPPARAGDWITYDPKPGPGSGKQVVLLSGDEEYRSEEGLPMLAKILSQRHGFKCTVLFTVDPDGTINPENGASLPGAEALDSADAIVMLLRFRHWPDDQMKHFVDAYRRGVPIVALRTSTHAFQYPRGSRSTYVSFNSFGKRVLGEGWVSHWGRHKVEATRGAIEPSAKDDPILRGVSDVFGNSDVYEVEPPADVKTLLRGQVLTGMNPGDPPADYRKKRSPDKVEQGVNDPMMPVAWTRLFPNEAGATNRIFCTTMGAATDLENEGLRRLIVNSVYWGLNLDVPAKADVAFVDEYKPTMYGFKGHRRGTKPDDYALGKPTPAGSPAPPPEPKKPASPRPAAPQAAAPGPSAWPAVTAECKPWTRWWWLGSAVDKPNITRILEEFKQAGIGGVEITPIYGAKGSEHHYIDFLSPKWMEMLAHTTAEAKRLGLGVDMATGTGWPFGGPTVSADDASARAVLKSYDLAGGASLTERLPAGKLQCLRAVAGDGTQLDLTGQVKDGRLDWTAPAGKWRLYALVQQTPVQKVKRAAPGGVGNVLDPYSVAKLNRYLAGFDRAFAGFRGPNLRGQFHDSFEYYGATWTDDFFDQFQRRRGYDLRTQLSGLFGEGPEDTVARVKHDYRETISDLHLDYVKRWTEWCHSHGWVSRNQAHGGPGNLIDTYAASDIPEMEVYRSYSERQMPMMKLAASAAHLSGRNLASAESFTWLGEHFQVPLAQVKHAADYLFLSGVNHVLFHGIPYSPQDVSWPGWQFYAAVNFGPGGGLWRDLPAFNAYVARCQSVLQAGRPSNDVLLYFPFHDFWQRPAGLLTTFATEGTWMESHPVHETALGLWKSGYGFDMASDRLLADATVDRRDVVVGGNHYKRVVVPPCRTMPPDTLRKLAELAREGVVVLFQSGLPGDVPSFSELSKRQTELKDIVAAIEDGKAESASDDRGRWVRLGKGIVVIGGRLERALAGAPDAAPGHRVEREWMTLRGLRFVRRDLSDGHFYFVTNGGEKPVDGWVPLGTRYASAVLMDPLFPSRVGKAAVQSVYSGQARQQSVYLQLEPGESTVIRTFHELDAPAPPWRYAKPAGEPVALTGPWKVEFIEGGPELPAAFTADKLESWTKRGDHELQRFGGTARYAIEFDRPADAADDWQLDLGRVCESARVRVNGRPVGTLFSPPFRVAVGEHLRPGKNLLEIEVTNLAANRVRDLDRCKVNWKYFHDANVVSVPGSGQRGVLDASNWPLRDSGLLGPVTLTPMKTFTPD